MTTKPQPLVSGETAPTFSATTFDGQQISLDDFKGKKVALYFYPKDDTPGCTKQACNLRDNIGELANQGIVVIGVSPDDDLSHRSFSDKYTLNFSLIADPKHTIINAYGVWGERKNYGKTYMGLQRTTFLIDEEGQIQHVFKRPRTADHAAEILSKL